MLASVVIVTRNRSDLVIRCLSSVYAQNYSDSEVIVVDNASDDNTLERIKSEFPSVILLPQPTNTGAPEGRNIGIRRAHGEICICLDDDAEMIGTSAISQCIGYFQKDPQLGCLSMCVLDEHGEIVTKLIPRRDRKVFKDDRPAALFSATGCALRRSAFMEAGEFWADLNPYFGEEPELSYRLLDRGYTMLQTPHICVRHYKTPSEALAHQHRRIYFGTRNTLWLALRNLPWYSVFGLTTLAWGYFFLIAVRDGQLPAYGKGLAASLKHAPAVYRIRKPISREAQQALWEYSGLILI